MLKWLSRLFNRRSSSKVAERKTSIEQLILNHQRRLEKLKEHQASPYSPSVPPEVLMEIEDIEIKIQKLQTALEKDDGANRGKTEASLTAHKRRLETLRKIEFRNKVGGYEQEIQDIEVKIKQLQAELEQLGG